MRRLSIAAAVLVATMCSPLPASAGGPCVQDEYGRVACGAGLYPGSWYDDRYVLGSPWPIALCPPGTVAGNYQCVAWRLPRGAKCPPNMWVVDGFCRPYSARY